VDEHWIYCYDGSKYRIPRYYDEKYKALDGLHFDVVKDERILDARGRPVDPNKDCRRLIGIKLWILQSR